MIVRQQKPCNNCQTKVDSALRVLRCANGALQLKFQCLTCGRSVTPALPHTSVDRIENIEPWDRSFQEREELSRLAAMQARDAQREALEANSADWWESYNDYLRTPEWQHLRLQVIARERGLCQGCRASNATHVHHLTYENVTEEFLFQLILLCAKCHARIHPNRILTR